MNISQRIRGSGSLTVFARDSSADPFCGALYVFCARRADQVKIVWWDCTGLWLFAERLDDHGVHWPGIENGVIRLLAPQLLASPPGGPTVEATN